jgi:hypothetical protein
MWFRIRLFTSMRFRIRIIILMRILLQIFLCGSLSSSKDANLQHWPTDLHGSIVSLHGSRVSIHGSRVSLHGSRVSLHGSRVSLHGSRVSLHDSILSLHSFRVSSLGAVLPIRITFKFQKTGEIFKIIPIYELYSSLLHLPLLRFHYVGGC